MKGYLHNPEATCAALADGWLHTGDLAVLHPDGYVEIKDRAKDIIISGGENISSLEIEEVLYQHPEVVEAAVVARRIRAGARHPTRSSPCGRMPYPEPRVTIWSAGAASAWRTSRHRGM